MDSMLNPSHLLYLVPSRCSSGFDRYRQEWLAYGCAQEVSYVGGLLWSLLGGSYQRTLLSLPPAPIMLLLVALSHDSLIFPFIPDVCSVLL